MIRDGRNLTEMDVLHATEVTVLGSDVVDVLFPEKDPLGNPVTVNGKRYTVVGVFDKKGGSFGGSPDNILAIPISTFDRDFPQVRHSHQDTIHIATVPKSPELIARLVEEGTNVLRIRRKIPFNAPNDFAVWTSEKLIEQMQSVSAAVSGVLVLIAGIALLVGGVGVMNIMLVSVTERTREIGLRKSVGALRRDIVVQFLTEAVALTLFGGIAGVCLGLLTAWVVGAVSPLKTATPLWSIGLGLGVSATIGLFFGIYPAVKASRLDPIEALRYE